MTESLFYQVLRTDHRQTECLLEEMNDLVSGEMEINRFANIFSELQRLLKQHYYCEEHGLFPVLNQYRTMMLMEVEHDHLLQLEQKLQSAIKQRDKDAVALLFHEWQERLRAHIEEEENGVFPLAEKCLEPEEKALVARKLQELFADCTAHPEGTFALPRPDPTFLLKQSHLFEEPSKPIVYNKLFELDHASLHHLYLGANQQLKEHMSGEAQYLVVVSGCIRFVSQGMGESLTAGQQVAIEPRLKFSLQAVEDSHLVLMKVWPRPHFTSV